MSVVDPLRSRIAQSLRRIRSAAGGTVVVLTYHRITDAPSDPLGLAVTPACFDEHLTAFAGRYQLMNVGDVLRLLKAGRKLPRRGLAITFDDGYADALTHACPLLEAYSAPATLFVATGPLLSRRAFWWDELERLVLFEKLPERLAFPEWARITTTIAFEPDERLERTPSVRSQPNERNTKSEHHGTRETYYAELSDLLESLPIARREELLGSLRMQIVGERSLPIDKPTLNTEQLAILAGNSLVEIGAHTVNHVKLGVLPLDAQRDEIEDSKRTLQEILEREVISFSYPHGTPGSFTHETERLVRNAGFLGAVTTGLGGPLPWGSISLDTNRYDLPRTPTEAVSTDELLTAVDRLLGV